jgi:glycosyltransferase involved in cell wall biosynthesis
MTDCDTLQSQSSPNISIFILTRNEEENIRRCLDSVRWSNDVVIVDSYSEDRTVEIAGEYQNVRIYYRAFDRFDHQRNFGLHQIAYRNPWVFVIDADEVVELELAGELTKIARQADEIPHNVFLIRRHVYIDGRIVRRNITSDFWIERLIRPEAVNYEGAVHEKVRFIGSYGLIEQHLVHHQFAKGKDNWMKRRIQYAQIEAMSTSSAAKVSIWPALLSRNTLDRRASLKVIFYRLPGRWLLYLMYNMIVKLAFLDGLPGVRYVLLESYSQYVATSIMKEARRAKSG